MNELRQAAIDLVDAIDAAELALNEVEAKKQALEAILHPTQ